MIMTLPMLSLIVLLPLIVLLAVIVAAANVPVKVGDADRTLLPVPVLVVTPVPPFATAMVVPFQTPVVIVPMLTKLESVVTAVLTNVPEVGNVTLVVPVVVNVKANAPEVVSAPAKLTALPPIFPTVVANEPPVFVTSPVKAGKAAVGSVDAAAATPADPVPT